MKQILKLAYNNAGNSILALASNGIHLIWLWPRTGFNLDGKVIHFLLYDFLFSSLVTCSCLPLSLILWKLIFRNEAIIL